MGLDMYLYKSISPFNYYRKNKELSIDFPRSEQDIDPITISIKLNEISEIRYTYGYWRKANAIHRWFVEIIQKGNDDCDKYYVSKERLIELYELVNKVIASIELRDEKIEDASLAQKLLPTMSGLFFGSIEYDKGYYHDLLDTKNILERVINDPIEGMFYYSSSW
jgi:hypothetical protein